MPDISPRLFVTPEWLAAHLSDPDVQVVDGSWYLPSQNRNASAEFAEEHIPGAMFFDIDALSDHGTDLPHMLPDDATFAREAGAIGLSSATTVVVYDGAGLFSAPRVWWTLRLYGAHDVVILEGGLPRWRAEGRPLEHGRSRAKPATFAVARATGRVAALADIRAIIGDGSSQIVDARAAGRFAGSAPEPRPGLESGHMPGSLNLPFTELIADGRLKSPGDLRRSFAAAGVDLGAPVVASCGSGVTAAVLVLAMAALGKGDARLYDGSWSEYAAQPDSIIAKG